MGFDEALERFGFHLREERGFGQGARLHVASPNRYLTYTVHAYPDGSAIFSWEFALGEYLLTKGIKVGSDETLNQFAFPREELRGSGSRKIRRARSPRAGAAGARLHTVAEKS